MTARPVRSGLDRSTFREAFFELFSGRGNTYAHEYGIFPQERLLIAAIYLVLFVLFRCGIQHLMTRYDIQNVLYCSRSCCRTHVVEYSNRTV